MESSALPLVGQVILFLLVPPIGSCVWWLFSRATARAIQGGMVSEATKKRERIGFFVVLFAAYLLMFGIKIYSLFVK
jgi:hypothetical protein